MFENIETGWLTLQTDYPSNYQFFHLVPGKTQEAFDSLKNESDGSEPKITVNGSEIDYTKKVFMQAVDRQRMVYLCFESENAKFHLLNSTQYRYFEENKNIKKFNLSYNETARLGSSDRLHKNPRLDDKGFRVQKSKLSHENPYKYSSMLVNGQIKWLSRGRVCTNHVAEIVKLYKHGKPKRSLIINTGTHGDEHGMTVVQNPKFAEANFTKDDLNTARYPRNVSLHIVSRGAPPLKHKDYPNVDIIDAWCFSANTIPARKDEETFEGVMKGIFFPHPEPTSIAVDNSTNQQNFGNQSFGKNPHHIFNATAAGNAGGTNVGNLNSGTQHIGDNIATTQQPRKVPCVSGKNKRDADTAGLSLQYQPEDQPAKKKQKSRKAKSKTNSLTLEKIKERVIASLYSPKNLTSTKLELYKRTNNNLPEMRRFRAILSRVENLYEQNPKSFPHLPWQQAKPVWKKIVGAQRRKYDLPNESSQESTLPTHTL